MLTLFVILAVLAVMVGGAVLAARSFRIADDFSGGAVGIIIAPCVLSLYLVAAAMAVVIGWEDYKAAEDGMAAEAAAAQELYWSSTAFPEEEGDAVRDHLRTYLTTVVEDDWPRMEARGELSGKGDNDLAALAASVRGLSVSDTGDGLDRLTARQEITELSDARGQRANAAGDQIPTLLTVIAVVTAVVVAVLPFAMIKQGARVAYFWASVNLAFVFATIALLFALGTPYTGVLANDAGGLEEAIAGFDRADLALESR
ncbi:DUF4239 domain-containing protein [Nocardiopsis sp. NRRL B-16309]|uniref:bestrophin-like domain n=1 Tax=Nocardiopsis sp. NRRL B-16309 TaxID=1519494 RepID=UPI0006AF1CD7|nr:DUF4239 domain-containing protein [Nocardiopsis sp. NRRL B-16309]KOX16925.1 hypothetical protein ADL05_09900 [Nocardiopsis sp. NRRL B-16309]